MIQAPPIPPVSAVAVATLLVAVSTVSVGYGIVLPVLPLMLQAIDGPGAIAAVSRHTGLLTGLHAFALFIFAPLWGWLSDRHGRRVVLVICLFGFGGSLLLSSFKLTIGLLYAERFLTGAFAAGITPVVSAMFADQGGTAEWRSRRLAWVSMAMIAGFLLGPMFSGIVAELSNASFFAGNASAPSYDLPFRAVAMFAILVGGTVLLVVPASLPYAPQNEEGLDEDGSKAVARLVPQLRAISFLVAAAVAVFEVGIALRGNQKLGMTPGRVALMFTTCSLVMFIVQAVVFSSAIKPSSTRWLIAPGLASMSAVFLVLPHLTDYTAILIAVAVFAASSGALFPILTYWVSLGAGPRKGAELGKQSAIVSLGQALGSVAGGSLFAAVLIPAAPYILFSILLLLAAAFSFRLLRHQFHEGSPQSNLAPGDGSCASALTPTPKRKQELRS